MWASELLELCICGINPPFVCEPLKSVHHGPAERIVQSLVLDRLEDNLSYRVVSSFAFDEYVAKWKCSGVIKRCFLHQISKSKRIRRVLVYICDCVLVDT